MNPARHEGILDAYAQNGAVYQEYYAVYRELIKVKKELDAIITDEGEKQRKIDLLSYQVQEIEDASLTAGEEETLAARRKVLANASTIRERISQSYALLSGGDDAPGAVDLLGEAPMRSMGPPNWTAAFLLLQDSCWIFITPQKTFLLT